MQEQTQTIKCQDELNYIGAMIGDFINTLPPSTRATVDANAKAALNAIAKELRVAQPAEAQAKE